MQSHISWLGLDNNSNEQIYYQRFDFQNSLSGSQNPILQVTNWSSEKLQSNHIPSLSSINGITSLVWDDYFDCSLKSLKLQLQYVMFDSLRKM